MKAPKCKTCGQEHYGTCTGVGGRERAAAASLAAPKMGKMNPKIAIDAKPAKASKPANGVDPLVAENRKLKAQVAELEAENAKLREAADATERRRQAQRERMRAARGGLRRQAKTDEAI